jgi:hypothetical protein
MLLSQTPEVIILQSISNREPRSSGGISQMYARHACAIARLSASNEIAREVDELIGKLRSKFPSFDEFQAEFRNLAASEKLTRQKSLVRYILHKISDAETGLPLNNSKMTIEHLASQAGKGHTLDDDVVAEIKNLAWVSEEIQAKLGTKKIDVKTKIIKSEGQWVDLSLEQHKGDWDASAIRKRTDYLAKLAYKKIWNIA